MTRWTNLLLSALLSVTASCARAATRPNILFILTDDLGYGDVGVLYQNNRAAAHDPHLPAFATPNFDRLAAEGMQLRRHYCPAPVCAPSRASLLCGVHQGNSGVRDNQFDYPLENNHTLATVLREAGYATAAIGKYGLDGRAVGERTAGPLTRGFDFFFGYLDHRDGHFHYPKEAGRALYEGSNNISSTLDKCYTTDLWTARAKLWLAQHRATHARQPFFLYLAYDTPHARLQVPTQPYPAGGGLHGGVQWSGTPGHAINTAAGTLDSWIHPDYNNATYASATNPATPWPEAEKRHATMVRRIDDAVGDLLQTLKELGCDSNTLVVFTSDNGPHDEGAGDRWVQDPRFFRSFAFMDGIKRDCWEAGIRMATFVRWPGHITAGSIDARVSAFWDWMPTFAELGGVPAPARTDGVSLVPTLTGAGTQRPSTLYIEYNFAGRTPKYPEFDAEHRNRVRNQQQVVELAGYQGVRYNIVSPTNDFEIYNVASDPEEVTNLAGTSPFFIGLQQRMKERVLQLRRPLGSAPRPYDEELVPADSVSNLVSGLNYEVFEGEFPWVPDFSPLSPVRHGSCKELDLNVRTREDNIGLFYTGYLNIPADGNYTFYLSTDSRAFLRLHDASLIDADFGYVAGTEAAGSVQLRAGAHAFRLAYARKKGGRPLLTLKWSGPGITKQPIHATNFVHPSEG